MPKIKSALEIALEKTENIKSDKSTLESYKYKKEGKKLGSLFLKDDNCDLKDKIKSYSNTQKKYVKEGLFDVLFSYIVIPKEEINKKILQTLQKGFIFLTNDKTRIEYIFGQIEQFFTQYLENIKNLKSQMKTQYAPMLKQKEAELSKKLGSEIHLSPEQDPEYVKLLQKNLSQLKNQYEEALKQVKTEISEIFKKENK